MTNLVKRSVRKESIREVDYRRNKAAIISVLIIISKGNFQKEKKTQIPHDQLVSVVTMITTLLLQHKLFLLLLLLYIVSTDTI